MSQASAQYPDQQQQQQQPAPYQQQQAAPIPITSMIAQPPPQESPSIARPGGFRLNIQAYAGFGGTTTFFTDAGRDLGSVDLSPTFGLQVQGLIPIGKYVLLGPALSIRSGRVDGSAGDRFSLIGADVAFGGHYAIALNDSLAIDPYLLFTLGLAVGTGEDVSPEDVELGVGFGFRAGATLWFANALGVSFGLGYQSAHIFPETFAGSGHVRFQEIALELGLALRFGQ